MKNLVILFLLAGISLYSTGCISVKTHSTFEPIYMTLDVNLKVQLQQELSSIFGEIDAASSSVVEP